MLTGGTGAIVGGAGAGAGGGGDMLNSFVGTDRMSEETFWFHDAAIAEFMIRLPTMMKPFAS